MRCVRSGSDTGYTHYAIRTTQYALRAEVQQKTTGQYTCGRFGLGTDFRGESSYRGAGVLTQR
jgi:hypothetical protein